MADDVPAASASDNVESAEAQIKINIKSGTDQRHALTVPLSLTVGELKAKLSAADLADVPVERQRLIFSGRILKDHDTLETVKIKEGNTIHLVKSAASNARQNPANSSAPTAGATAGAGAGAPAAVPSMAAGTGNSPFAQLTGARHAGFHGLPDVGMFGPDGGMGAPPDPDALLNMLENPMFVSQMNEMMNNPQMMDMLLNSPHVRNNPQARMMLQNPEFRRLMLNPDMIRMQLQMQRAFQGNPGGGFAMPGETDTTAQTGGGQADGNTQAQGQQLPPQSPFAAFGQGTGGQANPFAALFNNPAAQAAGQSDTSSHSGATTAAQAPADGTTSSSPAAPGAESVQANPFASLFGNQTGNQGDNPLSRMTQQMMQNPEMMRSAMNMAASMMGNGRQGPTGQEADAAGGTAPGAAAGQQPNANPFAGLFNPWAMGNMGMGGMGGMGGAEASLEPPDNRPPEERYEGQLRQLNDMGFFEFERNVQALRRSGGSVQGAVEYLLSNL